MSASSQPKEEKGTPWWVVFLVFVALPVTLAFVISRQAGAQLIRRRAIASSHGWAIEVKNEGRRGWILHGFHRDVEFEAAHLIREGGGTAWRLRMPAGRTFPAWLLVRTPGADWQPRDYGTISTLVTRDALPPLAPTPSALGELEVFANADEVLLALDPLVKQLSAVRTVGQLPLSLSLVDDAVVLDGQGDLPEGEALLPYLDLAASVVRVFSPDAG